MVVPLLIPASMPVAEPMVPTAILLLLHVPPAVASESVVAVPAQIEVRPVMAVGDGATVNETSAVHPVPKR